MSKSDVEIMVKLCGISGVVLKLWLSNALFPPQGRMALDLGRGAVDQFLGGKL